MNPFDQITITENVSMVLSLTGVLSQSITLAANTDYQVSYAVTVTGSVAVQIGNDYYRTVSSSSTITDTFSHGAGSGSYTVSFTPMTGVTSLNVDSMSVKKVISEAVVENEEIKEFLTGVTDEGIPIFFRADTQILQLQSNPEMYSQPVAIHTEMERGSMTKAFVSLDDKPFYEVEGTVTKGISSLKIGHTPAISADTSTDPKNQIAKSIQVSYRDSSEQLNRLVQAAIVTISTPIDHSP